MTINSRWSSTLENWFCQKGVMLLFRNRTISGSIYWVLRFKTITYPASENCLQISLQLNRGRHRFESNALGFERDWFCGRFKFSLVNLLFLNSIFQRCSEAEENLRRTRLFFSQSLWVKMTKQKCWNKLIKTEKERTFIYLSWIDRMFGRAHPN